jgi:hypothetical protein
MRDDLARQRQAGLVAGDRTGCAVASHALVELSMTVRIAATE